MLLNIYPAHFNCQVLNNTNNLGKFRSIKFSFRFSPFPLSPRMCILIPQYTFICYVWIRGAPIMVLLIDKCRTDEDNREWIFSAARELPLCLCKSSSCIIHKYPGLPCLLGLTQNKRNPFCEIVADYFQLNAANFDPETQKPGSVLCRLNREMCQGWASRDGLFWINMLIYAQNVCLLDQGCA